MGGLLGLFMGFSVFSIIEVLYFLSIRPYCNYLKNDEKRRRKFPKLFKKNKIGTDRIDSTNINETALADYTVFPHVN